MRVKQLKSTRLFMYLFFFPLVYPGLGKEFSFEGVFHSEIHL